MTDMQLQKPATIIDHMQLDFCSQSFLKATPLLGWRKKANQSTLAYIGTKTALLLGNL